MNKDNFLYTFIIEYRGGTYCSQFYANCLRDAVVLYNAADPSGVGAVPLDYDDTPSNLDRMINVWCLTGFDTCSERNDLIFANVIKTCPAHGV